MKDAALLSKKATDLLAEAETYVFYRRNLQRSLAQLFRQYQEGTFTYVEYEQEKKKFLKGRREEEWTRYYDSYILSLLNRVEAYNNQIFYETYNDQRYKLVQPLRPVPETMPAAAPARVAARPAPERRMVPAVRHTEVSVQPHEGELLVVKEAARQTKEKPREKPAPAQMPAQMPAEKQAARHEELPAEIPITAEAALPQQPTLVEIKPSFMDRVSSFFTRIFTKREVEAKIAELRKPEKAAAKKPAQPAVQQKKAAEPLEEPLDRFAKTPFQKKLLKGATIESGEPMELKKPAPEKKRVPHETFAQHLKHRFFDIISRKPQAVIQPREAKRVSLEKKEKQEEMKMPGTIMVGGFFSLATIKRMFGAQSRAVIYTEGPMKEVGRSTLEMETLRRKAQPDIEQEIEKITATALTKEASRIRAIMQRRKTLKIYQPSFFGSLANVTIKKISLYLLDTFPDFFKDLYHALRLANIKVLSNTYVNMMVLGVVVSFFIGLVVMGIFFAGTGLPLAQMLFRTVMMSLLVALVAFAGFYQYPYSILKQRRRSINSNLPFAINHMAAVASSGVAPTRMFQLISQSKEYGEISTELEKIVNYIEIFGYDILTALKSVGATTPSDAFKDFIEGMVSTTESGGDIKSYLSQKSDESITNYKLDRQKYTETISTYSDIYTGILIAAPLFFVAALSLVSLLGGKIGGIGVNVIIVMGTYVLIPVLNIGFLAFLEMSQPEI